MVIAVPRFVFLAALAVLGGCGGSADEDRQPSAAEVKAFTDRIEREDAAARAKAIAASRAEEERLNRKHLENVPAQD